MIGRGNNKRKSQQRGMNSSQLGLCVCPQCNYSVAHKRGTPCTTCLCPNCNIPLRRQTSSDNSHIQAQPEKNTKASDFPVINPDLCKGCGACVDICPAEAIKLEDGKAIISTEKCKNCNACARVCPAGAIT